MNFVKYVKPIVLFGVFGSAVSLILIKVTTSPPFVLLFYRFLFAMLMIGIPILPRKGKMILQECKKQYKTYMITGLLFVLPMILWIVAIRNTSIASCVIISNSHPLFVVCIAVFILKEKIPQKAIAGAIITVVGCTAMSILDFFNSPHHLLGDMAALAVALVWAIYLIYVPKIRNNVDVETYVFLTYGFAFIYIIIVLIVTGQPIFPIPQEELVKAFLLALFSTIVGQVLIDWGLAYVSSSFASLVFLMEPVFTIILAMMFLSEFPALLQVVCGFVIMLGIYIFNKYEHEKAS